MWRNYLTVAIRALAKSKAYSIINIAGLAIGMAACIMILLYVRYEESYDEWLPNAENTYQLQAWYPTPDEGDPLFSQMTAYVTKALMLKDFPQIERAIYAQNSTPVIMKNGQASLAEDYLVADDNFFDVIRLPMVAGTTLTSPNTAVLSQSEAIKQFGTDDVIGQTLSTVSRGKNYDYKVVGVMRDLPKNSHIEANAVLRLDFESWYAESPQFLTAFGWQSGWVWATLKPGTNIQQIEAAMPAWEKRNIPDETNDGIRSNQGDSQDWHFVNVKDIHLGKAQNGDMTPGNDARTVATFAIIALLILAMAVVNFTNLATARASQRAREVALRKVLGANRRQLIVQFLSESLLISALSMLVALALVELLVRPFASFLEADFGMQYLGADGILLPSILLTIVVGLLSGLYPAIFISRFQPAQVLKANRSASETPGSGRLRTALVIGQFAISTGLIICTAVVYSQTVYARTADPGYKRDGIIQVEELSRSQLTARGEMIVEQMKRVPGVTAVGRTGVGVNTGNTSSTSFNLPGATEGIDLGNYEVDEGFFDAMGLTLKAGRWFDPNREMDDQTTPFPVNLELERALAARGANVVINEAAVRRLGFKSNQEALGKTLRSEVYSEGVPATNLTIVGVVGDTRFRSARLSIEPIMYRNANEGQGWMIVRYHGDPKTVMAAVEAKWKQLASDVPFNARFSEDIIAELYNAEEARAQIFAAFALLAVLIGCLGLFGLASFTAERRTKEIGIRKVLGARTRDIVQLLVWQFSRPVIVANVIAWPVAWWVMRDWLNGFDQRIGLGPAPFLLAAAIALSIAVLTVVWHAIRIARSNPIHALRYE